MDKQILDGVKGLDFGWAVVGGTMGKNLADHGAQVIRIESITRPDISRMNRIVSISKPDNPDDKPWFTYMNTSKLGMTLNIRHPRARSILEGLIRWADVVVENFTPGTMTKLGLDYEQARKLKPDIIMASASGYGQTGPLAREWGIDGTASAMSGRMSLTGWPDRSPIVPTSLPYGDAVLPLLTVMGVVAALDYRRRTGKGQHLEASMFEACAWQVSPTFLDWQTNGNTSTRTGNRTPEAAPHGVFPCLGIDRWCAIAVRSHEEWMALCQAIGNPDWTKEQRFATLASRKQNEDELDELVSEWTKSRSAEEIMHLLQAAGVPAGVVQNMQDLLENDPQFQERDHLVPREHPVLGVFRHPQPPYKFSKSPAQVKTSPCMGEHTFQICTEILGISAEEFADLFQDGVFE